METTFHLQPSKIRQTRLVPIKGAETVKRTWSELEEELVSIPSSHDWRQKKRRNMQRQKLRMLQVGAYVGRMESRITRQPTPFVLMNVDRGNRVDWVLDQDPLFPQRLEKVYRVLQICWGDEMQAPVELGRSGK